MQKPALLEAGAENMVAGEFECADLMWTAQP